MQARVHPRAATLRRGVASKRVTRRVPTPARLEKAIGASFETRAYETSRSQERDEDSEVLSKSQGIERVDGSVLNQTVKANRPFDRVRKAASRLGACCLTAAALSGVSLLGTPKPCYAAQERSPTAVSVSASSKSSSKGEIFTLAQEDELDKADTSWVLTSTALVLFMTIPGLSLFYAGLVKRSNVLSVLMHCFVITAMMTVMWVAFGYSLSFSTAGMEEGAVNLASFVGGLDKFMLLGVTESSLVGTIPEALWVMFQMTFAIITPALMVGAFVERMKFSAMLAFVGLFATFIYYPVCHMVWSGPGALMADLGVLDFAGGIVVHITAGFAALLACIMVGPRKENKMTPHSLPMTVTGAGMLWVGWFGFNAGSAAASGALAASAMLVTQVSAATATLVWMVQDWMFDGKPTMLGAATGSIAGLASITPAAGFVGVPGAFAIGIAGGIICRWFALSAKTKYGYDDSLDVFGVHGMGGFLGTILCGLFCSEVFGGNQGAISIPAQVGVQTLCSVVTVIYTLAVTWLILKGIDKTIGLRVSQDHEASGLDAAEHGEVSYIE